MHPKIYPNHIKANGSFLNQHDFRLIDAVSSDVQIIRNNAQPTLNRIDELQTELNTSLSIPESINALKDYITGRDCELSDNQHKTYMEMQEALFEQIRHLGIDKKITVEKEIQEAVAQKDYQKALAPLNTLYENYFYYEENLLNEKQQCEETIDAFKDEINNIKNKHNVDFYVSDDFQLEKIKKSNQSRGGPEFSVLLFNHNGQEKRIALYRGKEQKLGQGAFGKVKIGMDLDSKILVAVKSQDRNLLPSETREREAAVSAAMGLQLGNAVITEKNRDVSILKLLKGTNLDALDTSTLSEDQLATVFINVAKQVRNFHEAGYIHRDIKPENFMIDPETLEVTIIDFGFAIPCKKGETLYSSDEAGSEEFQAPEILKEKHFSQESDLFALGKSLEDLCKNHPHLKTKINDEITKLTEPDPSKRSHNLDGILKAIENRNKQSQGKRNTYTAQKSKSDGAFATKNLKGKKLIKANQPTDENIQSEIKPAGKIQRKTGPKS